MTLPPPSEETARGSSSRRSFVRFGAGRRVDLESDPVRILEVDRAGRGALAVGDDAVVEEPHAQLAEARLGAPDLVDGRHLEREMMKTRAADIETALALLPESDEQP